MWEPWVGLAKGVTLTGRQALLAPLEAAVPACVGLTV